MCYINNLSQLNHAQHVHILSIKQGQALSELTLCPMVKMAVHLNFYIIVVVTVGKRSLNNVVCIGHYIQTY